MDCATLRELIVGDLSGSFATAGGVLACSLAFAGRAGAAYSAWRDDLPMKQLDEIERRIVISSAIAICGFATSGAIAIAIAIAAAARGC